MTRFRVSSLFFFTRLTFARELLIVLRITFAAGGREDGKSADSSKGQTGEETEAEMKLVAETDSFRPITGIDGNLNDLLDASNVRLEG
ncbi:unnamed protein product, partial [Protopolystoma xenopodis]